MVDGGSGGQEAVVVARSDLIHREVGEQIFLLLPDGAMHWLKNATAVSLWRALAAAGADGASVASLAASLVARFEVERVVAERDVASFLRVLVERGLVRVSQSPTAAEGQIDLPEQPS